MSTATKVSTYDEFAVYFPWTSLNDTDPYSAWALLTGGKGLVSTRHGSGGVPDKVLVVLELENGGRHLLPAGIEIQPGYPASARYVTALMPFYALVLLFIEPYRKSYGIRRFELGMAVKYPQGARSSFAARALPIEGDVIGIVDYGCPFAHEHYLRTRAGPHPQVTSRIRYLWSQSRVPYGGARGDLPLDIESTYFREWQPVGMPDAEGGRLAFRYGAELRAQGTIVPKDDVAGTLHGAEAAAHHAVVSIALPGIDDLFERYRSSNGVVDEEACYEAIGYTLMRESATHGSHVMDVAAGWRDPLRPPLDDAAPDAAGQASIIFVQFPADAVGDTSGGSMNAYALDALRYIAVRTEKNARVVVNMSYGTFAGPHDGTTLLEKAIDELIAERPAGGFQVVLPAGNSVNSACHSRFELLDTTPLNLHWDVSADDPTDSFMEIWYGSQHAVSVSMYCPNGNLVCGPVAPAQTSSWRSRNGDALCTLVHVPRAAGPYDMKQAGKNCVLIAVAPTHAFDKQRSDAPHGVYTVSVRRLSKDVVTLDAWIERDDPTLDFGWSGRQSRFVVDPQDDDQVEYPPTGSATKAGTLNTYATGRSTSVVGGCRVDEGVDAMAKEGSRSLSPYSAAGYPGHPAHLGGPDLVAPSDRSATLTGRLAGGTRSGATARMNGTSVAAPQLARALISGNKISITPPPKGLSALDGARWGRGTLDHRPSED